MRLNLPTHWLLASAPLLASLAVLFWSFGTEAEVYAFFRDYRAVHPGLTTFFQLTTDWANYAFYVFYLWMLVTALRSGDREKRRFVLIFIAVQVVVAGLAVHFLKITIGRPRPGEGGLFQPFSLRGADHSLPSGHTTEVTGAALPLCFRLRSVVLSAFLGLVIGALGFSRIYLGWHHPTDVFFGWLLGSVGGGTVVLLTGGLKAGD